MLLMKKRIFFALICLLFVAACQQSKNDKLLVANSGIHKAAVKQFSDSLKKDTFNIELIGDHPKNMSLKFVIKNYNGAIIYSKLIKGTEIIENYKHSIKLESEVDQINFLKEETNLFFDDENFLEPAVTEQEVPDQNTIDKPFYLELKKSGLNGFKYRLGNEIKVYIAWSVQEKKVKIYYKCC
jgi:hypothetical protein